MARPLPSIDELFDRFEPDSTSPSGLKYAKNCGKMKKGEVAGRLNGVGYYQVRIKGTNYRMHRIILALRTGYDRPDMEVDHIDRNTSNNHPFNLRWIDSSGNNRNRGNYGKYLKGVCLDKRRKSKPYKAQIKLNGKMTHLGYYATEEEAHQSYLRAVQTYQQP